jgi:hypothetical protein
MTDAGAELGTLLGAEAAADDGRSDEESCSTMVEELRGSARSATDCALDDAWLCLRVGGGTRHLFDQCETMDGAAEAGPETDQASLQVEPAALAATCCL